MNVELIALHIFIIQMCIFVVKFLFTGIENIVGKLLTGWLSDFSWVSTQTLSNIHVLLCGIAVFSMSFCVDSYAAFVTTAVVFGFSSSYVILKTIVLVELLGKTLSFSSGFWDGI